MMKFKANNLLNNTLETALPEPENDLEMPLSDMADEEDQEPIDVSGGQPSSHEASADKESSDSWWTDGYKQAKQYLYGDEDAGILQDFEKAHELFLVEAEADNPLALYDLGRMSADGLGCEADAEEAYRWYEKALAVFHGAEEEKAWKYTEYRIGKMYAAGLGTEQDYLQAQQVLREAEIAVSNAQQKLAATGAGAGAGAGPRLAGARRSTQRASDRRLSTDRTGCGV